MSFTNFCYFLYLRSKYFPQHSTPTPHTLSLSSYLKMCPDLGSCFRNTSRNTVVTINDQATNWIIRGSIPGRGENIFFPEKRPDRFTSPTSPLLNRCCDFCLRGLSGRSVKLINYHHLLRRARMWETIPLLPQHAFVTHVIIDTIQTDPRFYFATASKQPE
jgi:hypothetical protein